MCFGEYLLVKVIEIGNAEVKCNKLDTLSLPKRHVWGGLKFGYPV